MNLLKELELIKKENELLLKQNDDFEFLKRVTGFFSFTLGLAFGIIIGFVMLR